jgi:hypothetical protein
MFHLFAFVYKNTRFWIISKGSLEHALLHGRFNLQSKWLQVVYEGLNSQECQLTKTVSYKIKIVLNA